MRKTKKELITQQRVRDGVSIRVRFRDHEQIALIRNAAAQRGIARDLYIQRVLEAASKKVLAMPPAPSLESISSEITPQL